MGHLSENEYVWCKMCDEELVEDARHHMCQCVHDEYLRIRMAWYGKVKTRMGEMSPEMLALQKIMMIRNGKLESTQRCSRWK
mmetsp:Transcript_23470/g.32062  ORF Transcript_23470/g.32062 Transcript_23470/m.32062 type:complete len:82 (+) Transcript_23470:559-804(+)